MFVQKTFTEHINKALETVKWLEFLEKEIEHMVSLGARISIDSQQVCVLIKGIGEHFSLHDSEYKKFQYFKETYFGRDLAHTSERHSNSSHSKREASD